MLTDDNDVRWNAIAIATGVLSVGIFIIALLSSIGSVGADSENHAIN